MPCAAMVYQPQVAAARPLVDACIAHLDTRGWSATAISSWELDDNPPVPSVDMVVTFGGDGTILRAARWVAAMRIPIVGVQLGRLGFLAEVQPDTLPGALDPYLAGDCWSDERAMMAVSIAPGHTIRALNDVVIGRGLAPRTVTVDVGLGDTVLQRFRCDGVIVATATGSTAYSFAAGGPILVPASTDMVVTPICPHMSALRSVIVPGDTELRLQVWTTQPAVISVDGQIDQSADDGAAVQVRRSDCATIFARRGSRAEFYQRLLAKLN